MTQAANALARIFVGNPEADAKYRDQQIKNETEYLRQKQISEQTISEATRRKQMEAAAAASYGSANNSNAQAKNHNRENKAYEDLGNFFTQDQRNFNAPGGMSTPGDAPAGTPGAGIDMADPQQAAKVASIAMRGGIDPKKLAPIAMIPGQSDETLGHIMTGTGNTLNKDEYVSTGDRNKNRNYNVPAGDRMVGGAGNVIVPVDPSYVAHGGRGGNKVPKLGQQDMNAMIRAAVTSRGAAIDPTAPIAGYFSTQPELYANMAQLVQHAWDNGGGNAAAVQALLAQYLDGQDFSKFGQRTDSRLNPMSDPAYTKITPKVDLATLLGGAAQQPGINPEVFTGGGQPPLPNRQNVGNGNGWRVLGVQ